MKTLRLSAWLLPCVLLLAGCPKEAADPRQDDLAREHAAAAFEKQQYGEARTAIAALVARSDAPLEDLLRGAAVEYSDSKPDAARALLERARKLAPDSPAVNYLLGQLARDAGEFQAALPLLEKAHALAPGDLPTRLSLANVQRELGDAKSARANLEAIAAVGLDNGTSSYVAAVYQLMGLLIQEGEEREAQKYAAIWGDLQRLKIQQPDAIVMGRGNFGLLRPPPPPGNHAGEAPHVPQYKARPAGCAELAQALDFEAADLDGDSRPELWARTAQGVFATFPAKDGLRAVEVAPGAFDLARACDVDNDKAGKLDFVLVQGAQVSIWLQGEGAFAKAEIPLPTLPSAPSDCIAVDYDHEGDLDLVFVGAFGVRVWRNDGAGLPAKDGKQGQFTDATDGSGLPVDRGFAWAIAEDFDGDNDVDLLFGGAPGVYLADSLRGGRFADRSSVFPKGASSMPNRPVVADFDGDSRPDVWTGAQLFRQQKDGSFAAGPAQAASPVNTSFVRAADLDLDGTLDLVWAGTEGHCAQAALAVGLPQEQLAWLDSDMAGLAGTPAFADFDGNGTLDLALSTAEGVRVLDAQPGACRGRTVDFRGVRDNKRAVGALVEYRAGPIYRRAYWRGGPQLLGLGKEAQLDVLRITWPNGNVNTRLGIALAAPFDAYTQESNLYASCPFLYSWNGTKPVFVSDVLGITPLGLPIAPGEFVPPDHDEFVLVKGEQLVPKDGAYELHLTEELREVTYFDHARLQVVDHPADTEIFPNELFKFPPFPEEHTHTLRGALAPAKATGSDGKDWTKELAAIDDVYAEPFTLPPPQFVGLANPWFVELEFDKARVAQAKKLRLALTGWFFWSDASANMASARAPGVAFIPPMFQVPDGKGGWKDTGPPVGFPAGKTKTMVIDVASILEREDPRIRVFCALRLYWDSIRLAVDDDDAPLTLHTLEASSARLWFRGFSAPERGDPDDPLRRRQPERFDWTHLQESAPWNQHPGLYTRYGDVLPLVKAVDDQYVILGAGDTLTLRFDARSVPPLPAGMRRDYLVYLDGWAKDRDPNTVQAQEVEPLPFHAMSGYPYRADEHFPDDAAHTQWRAEWNTRPGLAGIRPLSAVREREWLAERP